MLYLTNTYINIQSLMGTLMMIGVVVNNSILLVEFANRRRAEGLSPHDAALSAAQVRLRPILMTSLTLWSRRCCRCRSNFPPAMKQ